MPLPSAPSITHPPLDIPGITRLFSHMDFIGISSYAPQEEDFEVDNLQSCAFAFFDEVHRGLHINLPRLMQV